MDKRAVPVAEISLERGEISLTGMEIFPYKQSRAGQPSCRDERSKILPQAVFNNCQNNVKNKNCPGKRDEIFSSRPARLLYKQALNLKIFWMQEHHQLYFSDNKYGRYFFGDRLSTYTGCSKKSDTIEIILLLLSKGFHAHTW